MDVEKFINLIYKQNCLWDQSDQNYHLRDVKRKAWIEVSKAMEISVDELKKRWRGLRDTFGKELKKHNNKKSGQAAIETDSKWAFFKNLLFLQNTITRRDRKGNVSDPLFIIDEDDDANESQSSIYSHSSSPVQYSEKIGEETQKITKTFKSPLRKKMRRCQADEIDNRLLEIEEEKLKCIEGNSNDPDVQFLMSLLPFLKDVPKERKLIARTKIQQVLMEEQTVALYPVELISTGNNAIPKLKSNRPARMKKYVDVFKQD